MPLRSKYWAQISLCPGCPRPRAAGKWHMTKITDIYCIHPTQQSPVTLLSKTPSPLRGRQEQNADLVPILGCHPDLPSGHFPAAFPLDGQAFPLASLPPAAQALMPSRDFRAQRICPLPAVQVQAQSPSPSTETLTGQAAGGDPSWGLCPAVEPGQFAVYRGACYVWHFLLSLPSFTATLWTGITE